jgi:hypothetical protein
MVCFLALCNLDVEKLVSPWCFNEIVMWIVKIVPSQLRAMDLSAASLNADSTHGHYCDFNMTSNVQNINDLTCILTFAKLFRLKIWFELWREKYRSLDFSPIGAIPDAEAACGTVNGATYVKQFTKRKNDDEIQSKTRFHDETEIIIFGKVRTRSGETSWDVGCDVSTWDSPSE